MSSAASRDELAAILADAVPDSWTVYSWPPEQISTPAAVVDARVPSATPGTFCAVTLGLMVRLITARTAGVEGQIELDELSSVVRAALLTVSGLVWESSEGPGLAQWGGADTLEARLNLELYT